MTQDQDLDVFQDLVQENHDQERFSENHQRASATMCLRINFQPLMIQQRHMEGQQQIRKYYAVRSKVSIILYVQREPTRVALRRSPTVFDCASAHCQCTRYNLHQKSTWKGYHNLALSYLLALPAKQKIETKHPPI